MKCSSAYILLINSVDVINVQHLLLIVATDKLLCVFNIFNISKEKDHFI